MDRLGEKASKLLERLRITDSNSAKFGRRKNDKPASVIDPAPHTDLAGCDVYSDIGPDKTARAPLRRMSAPTTRVSERRWGRSGSGEDPPEAAYRYSGVTDSGIQDGVVARRLDSRKRASLETHRYSAGDFGPDRGRRCSQDIGQHSTGSDIDHRYSKEHRYSTGSELSAYMAGLGPRACHLLDARTMSEGPNSMGHCLPTYAGGPDGVGSPRSSFASDSPRTSINLDCPSRPCSNRTSGISLGYDQRHGSPQPGATGVYSLSPTGSGLTDGDCVSMAPYPDFDEALQRLCHLRPGTLAQDSRHSYPPALGMASHPCCGRPHLATAGQPIRRSVAGYPEVCSGALGLRFSTGAQYQEELAVMLNSGTACTSDVWDRSKRPGLFQQVHSAQASPIPGSTQEETSGLEFEEKEDYFGTCIKCSKGIYGVDNACQALDSLYHTQCFVCAICGRTLREKAFYNVKGSVYCEEDYLFSGFQEAAEKCCICGHLILEKILPALGKAFHPGCFRCVVCNKSLDGIRFIVDYNNKVYCVTDYHKMFAPKCAVCGQPILPSTQCDEIVRVISMGNDYHFECYRCEDCSLQLSDKEGCSCFPLDGHLLCHSCHMQRLGSTLKAPLTYH